MYPKPKKSYNCNFLSISQYLFLFISLIYIFLNIQKLNYNIFIIYISFIPLLFHYIDYIYINNFFFFIIFRIYFSHNFQSTYIPYKFSKTSLTQKNNTEFLAQISFRKIFLPITMKTRYSELRTNKIINQCILEFIIYIFFFFSI